MYVGIYHAISDNSLVRGISLTSQRYKNDNMFDDATWQVSVYWLVTK